MYLKFARTIGIGNPAHWHPVLVNLAAEHDRMADVYADFVAASDAATSIDPARAAEHRETLNRSRLEEVERAADATVAAAFLRSCIQGD